MTGFLASFRRAEKAGLDLKYCVSNEGGKIKKAILALLLSVLMLMPNVSSSRAEPTSAKADVDKLPALHLKTKFRNIREDLSRVRNDLETISTSIQSLLRGLQGASKLVN
jgi:hypothetical protein